MNLILTMAGRYSRFVNEGYKIPKYLLPWGSKSILGEIIFELNKNIFFDNIFLIANKRDEIYMPHVKRILLSSDINKENLILISDTKGQAETAHEAILKLQDKFGKLNGPIIFHNIDTILYNRDFNQLDKLLNKYDGYIDIFKSSNKNYSYVLIENDKVKAIVEKIVVSNKATSGLYGFSSANKFLEFYTNEYLYISDVYQKMIDSNNKIVVSELYSENDTVVLGTPSEYLHSLYLLEL